MTIQRVQQWLRLPHYEDEEQERIAHLLHILTLALLGVALVYFITLLILARYSGLPNGLAGIAITLTGLWLLHKGHLRAAIYLVIAGVWSVLALAILFAEPDFNIFDLAFPSFVLPILLAGFLLNGRIALLILLGSVLIGLFAAPSSAEPDLVAGSGAWAEVWITHSMIFCTAVGMTSLANNSLRLALVRARRSEREVTDRNRELQTKDALAQEFQRYLKALHDVNIRLALTPSLDQLYQMAIEQGVSELGFDRLAVFRLDESTNEWVGTYGTNPLGEIVSVKHVRFANHELWFAAAIEKRERVTYRYGALLDNLQPVGTGWNAVGLLRDGDQVLGVIFADNLRHQAALDENRIELLSLFTALLSTLIVEKQAQERLRENEERLRLAVRASRMIPWEYDVTSQRVIYPFRKLPPWPGDPHTIAGFLSGVHPDDRATAKESIERSLREGSSYRVEYRYHQPDGNSGWALALGEAYRDAHGNVTRIVGFTQDITQRKQADESQRTQMEMSQRFQEQLKSLNEVSLQLAKVVSLDELYRQAVELGRQQLGFDRVGLMLLDSTSGVIQHTYGTDEHGNLVDERSSSFHLSITDEWVVQAIENRLRVAVKPDAPLHNPGRQVGHGWNAIALMWENDTIFGWLSIDNLIRQESITIDQVELLALYGATVSNLITRKRAEDALQRVEEQERDFLERLKSLHRVSLELSRMETVDDLHRRAVELGQAELGFERIGILMADGEDWIAQYGIDPQGNPTHYQPPIRLTPGTAEHWVEMRPDQTENIIIRVDSDLTEGHRTVGRGWNVAAALRDGARVIGWLVSDNLISARALRSSDIELHVLYAALLGQLTLQKQTQQQLRENEERLILALKAAHMRAWTWNIHSDRVIRLDPETRQVSHLTLDDFLINLSPDRRSNVPHQARQALEMGRPYSIELPFHNQNEPSVWLHIFGEPYYDVHGKLLGMTGVTQNVTDRKEAVEALRQSEKSARTFQEKLKRLHQVNLHLSTMDNLDDLYRAAIEQGRDQLGFDRLGLFFFDFARGALTGTFGTDPAGQIRDERDYFWEMYGGLDWIYNIFTNDLRVMVNPDNVLTDNLQSVGHGWNALAALWDGNALIGWLSADNLIRQEPLDERQIELLSLYAALLGHLITEKKTLRDLRDRESRLQLALEAGKMQLFEWKFNTDTIINYASQHFALTPAEEPISDWHASVHPDDREMARRKADEIMVDMEPYRMEYRLRMADDTYHWVQEIGQFYRDESGETTGTVGIVQDIHERKLAEERFYTAFYNNPSAIAISERFSRHYVDVNESWARLFGYPREAYIGRNAQEMGLYDESGDHDSLIAELQRHDRVNQREIVGRNRDGRVIYGLVSLERIEIDGTPYVISMIQDITERKRMEQQALEFELQRQRIAMMTEFFGNVSHDLKTPLAVIRNSLYLIERFTDPQRQKDKINLIYHQTDRLERSIQDILTITRLDNAGSLTCANVPVNVMIDDLLPGFKPVMERKHIKLELNLPKPSLMVWGDARELDRVLTNLVENAINYTPEDGSITIESYSEGDQTVIDIRDTGIGINAEDVPRIFERFYRADRARSTHSGGTGLGLAIVKRIMDMHHAPIEVSSTPEQGTRFRLRLAATQKAFQRLEALTP